MSEEIDVANDPAVLRPTGNLGIYEVRALKDSTLDALARHPGLVIDLSGVNNVDAAGLQFFALLRREAASAGKTLRLQGGSVAWVRLIATLGMQAYFGDSLVMPYSSDPLELEHEHGPASADIL